MSLIFRENFLPLYSFLPSLCASGTELCPVKIDNAANTLNKVVRHAVYTCCTVKGCNIVYTYLYATVSKEVAHLPTKFTLLRRLLSNKSLVYEFLLAHLAYIRYTEVAGVTPRMN